MKFIVLVDTKRRIKRLICLLLTLAWLPAVSLADTMDDEIEYLIDSVGKNGCKFIRNDRAYSGRNAREHLRSKRRNNAALIGSTEEFIGKIASESATSGKPYLISCRDEPRQTANEWFSALLEKQRGNG